MSYHRALFSVMGNNTSTTTNVEDESNNGTEDQFLTSKVEIKKLHENVTLPEYKTTGSSGVDICAYIDSETDIIINPGEHKLIKTGFSIAMPNYLEAQVRPRSGLALKFGITIPNTPGTIDSDYRGEVGVILRNEGRETFIVKNGDRIAQLVFVPVVKAEFIEVEELSETVRGEGGFGSTGVSG